MIYPTITELTKDEFNRYELALATAKCARMITDEYTKQYELATKSANGTNKEAERNIINMLNKEYRDEKAVKNAINRIHSGEYVLVRKSEDEYAVAVEASETQETAEASEETAE